VKFDRIMLENIEKMVANAILDKFSRNGFGAFQHPLVMIT